MSYAVHSLIVTRDVTRDAQGVDGIKTDDFLNEGRDVGRAVMIWRKAHFF